MRELASFNGLQLRCSQGDDEQTRRRREVERRIEVRDCRVCFVLRSFTPEMHRGKTQRHVAEYGTYLSKVNDFMIHALNIDRVDDRTSTEWTIIHIRDIQRRLSPILLFCEYIAFTRSLSCSSIVVSGSRTALLLDGLGDKGNVQIRCSRAHRNHPRHSNSNRLT